MAEKKKLPKEEEEGEYSEDSSSDSDEDEDEGAGGAAQVASGQQGEPDWYDPEEDERHQQWASKRRRGRQSDAILSCPACLSTVCIDCQRHAKSHTQYRAAFTVGCRVRQGKDLPEAADEPQRGAERGIDLGKRKRGERAGQGESGAEASGHVERLLRVDCEVCGTEVAKLDEADVYHFFNVIPSYS